MDADHEDSTSSTLDTLSTQDSTGISEYKEYLRIPLDDEKQKALEEDLGKEFGTSDPAMCKILAAKFRDYQLRDLQEFDSNKLKRTYEIPDHCKLPAIEKRHDHVEDISDNVDDDFYRYLAEWTGTEDA